MGSIKSIVLAIVCFLMSLTMTYGSSNIIEHHANWICTQNEDVDKKFAMDVTKFVFQNCDHPELVLSIINEESKFNPKAYNKSGVYGLGQIKFRVWRHELQQFNIRSPNHLYNYKNNILAMNYIVEKYYKESKDIQKTVCRYLGGAKKSNAKYRYKVHKNLANLTKSHKA